MTCEFRMVDINKIQPNFEQPRKHFDQESLNELAVSIKEIGILVPIQVQPINGNQFKIIDGERRFHAAKLAGVEKVEVLLKPVLDGEVYELSVISNLQREDMTPLEIAIALNKLVDEGRTTGKVAHMIGKSEAYVKSMLKLVDISPRLKLLLEQRQVAPSVAKVVSEYKPKDQRRLAILTMKRLKEIGNWNASHITRIVREESEAHSFEKIVVQKKKQQSIAELLVRDVEKITKEFNHNLEQLLGKDELEVQNVPGVPLMNMIGELEKSFRLMKRAQEFTGRLT